MLFRSGDGEGRGGDGGHCCWWSLAFTGTGGRDWDLLRWRGVVYYTELGCYRARWEGRVCCIRFDIRLIDGEMPSKREGGGYRYKGSNTDTHTHTHNHNARA